MGNHDGWLIFFELFMFLISWFCMVLYSFVVGGVQMGSAVPEGRGFKT